MMRMDKATAAFVEWCERAFPASVRLDPVLVDGTGPCTHISLYAGEERIGFVTRDINSCTIHFVGGGLVTIPGSNDPVAAVRNVARVSALLSV